MCCQSSYNQNQIFRWYLKFFLMRIFVSVKYVSIVSCWVPKPLKMLQKTAGVCFVGLFSLAKKIKYFYSWKIAELPERKRKDADELRTSVRSMIQRRKCWIRLSEDHEIMLSKQLRTGIRPDVKTNWPRTENSFPTFQQITLSWFLTFKLYIPFHCKFF